MLIRFIASNFRSLKEEVEFNMLTGAFKTHAHHVYKAGKVEVLRAAAIYGANGAGKSNLVKAIAFLRALVDEGKIDQSVSREKFKLDAKCEQKPIEFEIEFFKNKKIYKYGVSLDQTTVVEEWLYESGITKDDKLIFERKSHKGQRPTIRMADKYSKTAKAKLLIELMQDNLLKNNQLLLGKNEELKIAEIDDIRECIVSDLFIINPDETLIRSLPRLLSLFTDFKNLANHLLPSLDTGIKEITTESIDLEVFFGKDDKEFVKDILEELESESEVSRITSQGEIWVTKEDGKVVVKKAITQHRGIEDDPVTFELSEESDGTRRLVDYIPVVDLILNYPTTVIIDEIDRSLHPHLVKTLLQKLMSDPEAQGQLIFTTHESNLLDLNLFRQDEIWFAEKESTSGSTHFYSLSDFKPRYDLDIRKGYLNGRFGAIPFLAPLENLNWHQHAEAE
ncbi:ATP-binding protein [Cytophagaceae bacterium DM2B3-1]|uniref:ATP-binding protein n=1 Tax=Xanthocytophaga flava TaxID=3048013 RepID=A0ABT7CXE3_9BACT|nr:ATP-binding protein [Xanthocytophaga flavus]MDJ1498400.1 ATP-binding protein [Xanthocytophaga flavus]